MRNVDPVDLIAGLLVLLVGLYFAIGATAYRMGSIMQMGPGFVPFWMGIIAAGFGLAISGTALGRSGEFPRLGWRAVGSVLGAVLVFGLLLPNFGLIVATFCTAVIAMLGNPKARARGIAVTATVITLVCWGIFIGALGLPIRAWDAPF